ncbi:T9SS type A sorting domain-containing protein [Fulvivirga ulvae]|nr:T9SS type A sorting domain-containing protein [Fulvivirga ulvae]UII31771.1 T9SS type A sorting domain-containing protein [Fulvivirga ulvae]
MGVTRLEFRDHDINKALDIRRLTAGLYIVHVQNREEYFTQQLQIE